MKTLSLIKRMFFIVSLIILFNNNSNSQILTFEFSSLAGDEANATSNFNDPNLNSSTISRGAGLTASANGGRFNATSWALGSIANAVTGDDYMEFTISPILGYQFNVTNIQISLQRSASGPSAIALRNSLDSYATNLDQEFPITDNTSTQTFTFTINQALSTSAVTYRIYMFAEATTGSGGPGDFAGNDIIVNGSVMSSTCAAPTTQASGINITNNALYSMTVNWTRGDGSEILVLCKEGSAVDSDPIDGTTYTANSIFGSGTQIGTGNYVIYKGTGTSVNLTGLNQNTTYYFQAYEFNCSGIVSKYNITDITTGNETTVALCTNPTAASTNLTFSNVTSGSMKLTWTNSTSNYRIVIAKKTTAVTAVPVDGTTYTANSTFGLGQQIVANEYVVYAGNGNNVTVTGLDVSTTYHYAIYEYCAPTGNGSEAYFVTPLTGSKQTNANIPATCFEIESILVDACARQTLGYQEGPNEMVRFRVGPAALDVTNLSVNWASANLWRGTVQNATTAAITTYLNNTIQSCGFLIEPPGGILPAGSKVLLLTSSDTLIGATKYFDLAANTFAYLSDTLYIIFQQSNSSNLGGHFANYSSTGTRNFSMTFSSPVGCTDAVSYNCDLYPDNDGDRVDYEWDGTPTYVNNGCQAPYEPVSVVAVNAYGSNNVCFDQSIPITGNVVGAFTNLSWSGGAGTFGNSSLLSTTYTPDISEIGDVTLYLNASNACGNVKDSIIISVYNNPVITLTADTSICRGTSALLNASGGTSYQWSNSATSNSITVSPTNTSSYTVTVSNAACSANSSVQVTVLDNPTVDLGADIEACENDIVNIDAGAGFTYNWSTAETSQDIDVIAGGNYSVTITDGNNCTDRDTIKITYHNPTVDLGANITDCEGAIYTLDAGAGFTYNWSTSETSQSIQINQSGNYYVTITDPYTCQTIDSINLLLYPNPIVNLGNDTAFCASSTLMLDAGNGFTYAWSNSTTNQTLSVSSTGTYHVTITDGNNCSDRDTINVTVNQLPTATHSTTQATCGNSDGSSTVTPSGGSGTYTYLWGASAGNQTSATASNLAVGVYNLTINDGNCPINYTVTITEIGAPTLTLTTSNNAICAGQSVDLSISGADTYLWSTGSTSNSISITLNSDSTISVTGTTSGCSTVESINVSVYPLPLPNLGNDTTTCSGGAITLDAGPYNSYLWSDNSSNQTLTVNTSGNYSVTVTDNNNCSNSDNIIVSLNPTPIINFGTISAICQGESLVLNPGTFSSYLWNDNSTNQSMTVNASGAYSVTVTDSNNCTADSTVNVTVNSLPNLELGNNQSACDGQTVTLDAGAGFSYLWSNSATTQTINTTVSGQFSVTITDGNGCENSDTVSVTINSNPNIDLGPNQQVCNGNTVTLDAGTGQSYAWNNSQSTQTINVTTSGTYSVTVTLTGGCSGSGSVIITFNDIPTLSLISDTSICTGNNLNISATSNSTNFLWSNGSSSNTITVTQTGTYTVTVSNSCGNNVGSVNATINQGPVIPFGNDTTIQPNTSITLDAGNSGSTYLWSTNETTQSIVIDEAGTYTLTITSAQGCVSTDTIVVTIYNEPVTGVHPYNTFTPNNDGVNDYWIIENIESFPNNSVEIYNRNGILVYSANRYKNKWDGKYNYRDLPEATYYFIIDLGNGSDLIKGHVTIVR